MPELVDVTPGSPDWLATRRTGITATDLPAILGISPYDSAYSLYWRKLGAIPDVPDCPRFRLGRELEPYIAKLWGEATGLWAIPGGLYRSSERPWQMATVDRMRGRRPAIGPVPSPPVDFEAAEVVELKSWADMDRDRWDDGPPPMVRAQVLWQMDVMGVARGHVAVLFLPSGDLRSYVIEHPAGCDRPDEVMDGRQWCDLCLDQLMMRREGYYFYTRLTDGNNPPDADGSAASLAAARARFTPVPRKVAIIDPTLWMQYEHWDKLTAQHKEHRTRVQIAIRELAGDCGDLEVDGQLVARFDKRGALRRIKAKEEDSNG